MSDLVVELIPDEEQGGFTARIPDIPAYGEGDTKDAAVADLREAIRGYIEAFGLEDALARVAGLCQRNLTPSRLETRQLQRGLVILRPVQVLERIGFRVDVGPLFVDDFTGVARFEEEERPQAVGGQKFFDVR